MGGNTDLILDEVLAVAKREEADTKRIRVSDYKMGPCDACRACSNTGRCSIDDDGSILYQVVLDSEGVILGSPSYFQGGNGSN